jgi:hypothetical protein
MLMSAAGRKPNDALSSTWYIWKRKKQMANLDSRFSDEDKPLDGDDELEYRRPGDRPHLHKYQRLSVVGSVNIMTPASSFVPCHVLRIERHIVPCV